MLVVGPHAGTCRHFLPECLLIQVRQVSGYHGVCLLQYGICFCRVSAACRHQQGRSLASNWHSQPVRYANVIISSQAYNSACNFQCTHHSFEVSCCIEELANKCAAVPQAPAHPCLTHLHPFCQERAAQMMVVNQVRYATRAHLQHGRRVRVDKPTRQRERYVLSPRRG